MVPSGIYFRLWKKRKKNQRKIEKVNKQDSNNQKKPPKGVKRVGKRAELVPKDATVCELSSQLFASEGLALRGLRPFSYLFTFEAITVL